MSDADAMVAWLRSVHAADEQAARDAAGRDETDTTWRLDGDGETVLFWDPMPDAPGMGQTVAGRAPHIARHDPAGTLARIEGERRIMELHLPRRVRSTSGEGHVDVCRMCDQFPARYPCGTLRALAYGYRHRGGWQEGWAP